ncbi:LPS-assembly protein LptD [Insolitispirillum peregrinum]|uniref:LPS-assembly protein LptD n=1 Tax=Insolitispirillum peregrinum TaxID=80876 RepID=A0A1N7LEW0_9PROT|nr:LPS assembly protein LptD [Insolitispirillum peregrinum]SIS72326.1 LPS-assembly protein [Insolitispirillum peregrinum]
MIRALHGSTALRTVLAPLTAMAVLWPALLLPHQVRAAAQPSSTSGKTVTPKNGAPLEGPGSAQDERAQITADELIHDKTLDTVTARGGVEIQYGGRILLADTVNYQPGKDHASATGNVTILEADGNTLFAEHVELDDKLTAGVAKEFRLILTDGSRAAARQAVRSGGNRTEMDHAVYSACDSCAKDPSAPPLWQIKALKVVHDQEAKDVTYHDAWVELAGVPVMYTPYMSHPDPSVKRQSGFLAPSYGGTSGLGATLTTPYYFAISPYQDFTFSPMFTTDEGVMLGGEYRLRGTKGELKMEGSITKDNDERIRNHFKLFSKLAIDDTWRAGADINLTSDDTYMRRYGFRSQSFLISRPYVEAFSRRSYAVMEGYYFQDLRSSSSTIEAPVVVPSLQWNYSSAPTSKGAYHTADLGFVSLLRDSTNTSQSADSRRLSASYGWHLPYVGPIGDVYKMDLSVRGDAYSVEDVLQTDGSLYTGTVGRVIPEAAFTWSLPFDRTQRKYHEIIEPMVQAVVSPRGQNSDKIPNEDSIDFEFDDTNLFSTNRFTGRDRTESGTRVNYAMRYSAYNNANGKIDVALGQTWHATPDGTFDTLSGLSEEFSDYVGRVQVRPTSNFDVLYRFRFDKDSLEARRNEVGLRVGPPTLRFSSTYDMLDSKPLTTGSEREQEQLKVGLSSQVSRYWRLGLETYHDLGENGGPLRVTGTARYDDECFTMDLSAGRDYTYDRDYEDGYRIGLRVTFKTLGEVQTSASQ